MSNSLRDMSTPDLDGIRDRWVVQDRWAKDCGESRVLAGRDHEVLEGLRHARQDVAHLLAELDRLSGPPTTGVTP